MRAPAEPVPFGEIDERADQVMVPMRDGVRLATDVYLPARTGRRATVLVRLPYDKSGRFSFMPQASRLFNERGYAFVAQDVRGKVRSEGEREPFVHEVADGWDTLEWIAAQPWSNGVVGMFGDSYYGFTQWAAAASGHPALRAIVPRMTSTEIGSDWFHRQGVVCLYQIAEWAAQTWVDASLYEDVPDFSVRPLADVVSAAHGGRRSSSFDRWIRTPPDDPSWTAGIFGDVDPPAALRIPALHSGGWWDVLQQGQVANFLTALGARAPEQHLIMGSTDHFDDPLLEDGEPVEDFLESEEALARFLPTYVGPALAFFERHLLGREGPEFPVVRWHLANEGWREAAAWPPPGARPLRLHLASGARAFEGAEGGALAATPDGTGAEVRWTHDAADPVPDLIEDPWRSLLGLPDERAVEGRGDVLTFTGEPAAEPLDLAGPVRVRARVGGSGPFAHLAAKLVDVFPNGRARRILQGIALITELSSGATVTVDLGHTGYRVRPGHRLRVELAASDFPRYLLDPGTGEDPWTALETAPADRAVRVGGAEGAALELTVLP